MQTRQYEPGEVIFRENDIGEIAYVIVSGRVEVLKNLGGQNIHIAYIGAGEPFGEMSMIDEKPRSATIVAVERTTVHELHRDDFVYNLRTHPELAISLLKVLFERLREADASILQLYRSHPEIAASFLSRPGSGFAPSNIAVRLEGLTPEARRALPYEMYQITKFPFRIGRLTSDALSHNDLGIPDSEPLQISRHHVSFIKQDARIGVSDRGSRLGSWVDGQRLGGQLGVAGPLFFEGSEGTLVLGDQTSRFQFRVVIEKS
jgi:CRP-like cAMP-binding protein